MINDQSKELILQEQKLLLARLEECYKYPHANRDEIKELLKRIEENKKLLNI